MAGISIDSMDYADPMDRASAIADFNNEIALLNRKRFEGDSLEICEDCGNEIPEKRRLLLPGISTCVECASIRERCSNCFN
ncbi:TraR/DksA family transcriptional regulator [Zooshikella sp. RANM57]|uniref:TraR/DksA family transcriptional regulator n=1 Tax=Zooshikella sp. RANM57 TaxID=3425863 RepID=UPI003D6EA341